MMVQFCLICVRTDTWVGSEGKEGCFWLAKWWDTPHPHMCVGVHVLHLCGSVHSIVEQAGLEDPLWPHSHA